MAVPDLPAYVGYCYGCHYHRHLVHNLDIITATRPPICFPSNLDMLLLLWWVFCVRSIWCSVGQLHNHDRDIHCAPVKHFLKFDVAMFEYVNPLGRLQPLHPRDTWDMFYSWFCPLCPSYPPRPHSARNHMLSIITHEPVMSMSVCNIIRSAYQEAKVRPLNKRRVPAYPRSWEHHRGLLVTKEWYHMVKVWKGIY